MTLDKISSLLEKAGANPELAGQISEALVEYKTSVKAAAEKEFNQKIEQAKKVCFEETATHKRELARRLAIWCEAKSADIDRAITKQSANRDGRATTTLESIKDLLEGAVPGVSQNGNHSAEQQKLIKQLQESQAKAIADSKRNAQMAERLLGENRRMAKRVRDLEANTTRTPVVEGRQPQNRRIDNGRQGGTPVTHRATTVDNQRRNVQAPGRATLSESMGQDYNVATIAAHMDE